MKNLISNIISLKGSITEDYINEIQYPWELINSLKDIIIRIGNTLDKEEFSEIGKNIWIHKTVLLDKTATIIGPCIIDKNAVVKVNAYIRENVIIGKNCVIGNSTELKNSILFDECKAPHFNYIGDSILGYKVHFGAGAITSNVKSDYSNISVKLNDIFYKTEKNKLGALIGDCCEIGSNCVIAPGAVIGKNTTIYPLVFARGEIKENKIVKSKEIIVDKKV